MAPDYSEAARRILRASLLPAILALPTALLAIAPARADAVMDEMNRAEAAYAHGDYAAALSALGSAEGMIRQAKADAWRSMLPPPPPGWGSGRGKAVTVSPALLGGGVSVERHYFREDGASIDISAIADSPALQSVASLLGAGLLVSSSDLMTINGQRVAYDADDNTLQAIVADKVLVKVVGSPGVDKRTLASFFRAIDLAEIERMAQ
jgi:hypothetical protein